MAINDEPDQHPKKITVDGEAIEEHSLQDRIAFDKHQAAQEDRAATPKSGRMGLGIFRMRFRNGRP